MTAWINRSEWYGDLHQLGSTRLVTLDEGPERGVRVIEFRNAAGLEMGVLVDRGFDIAWCRVNGRSLAWHSPTGFTGPWYREPSGIGFLRSFGGGLLTTCGLDHILFPEDDPLDTYNFPGRDKTSYGLHGRVGSTPASSFRHGLEDGTPPILVASGTVRQTGALAENLVLERRISVPLDENRIEIVDTVRNEGWLPTPHMILYHMNFGAPLLGPETEFVGQVEEVVFRSPTAESEADDVYRRFQAPTAGFAEQAFQHQMRPNEDGLVEVSLVNLSDEERPWGVTLSYDAEQLPAFIQWRLLDRGAYVVGLEPSTNGLGGRVDARSKGTLRILEPGAERHYRLSLSVIEGNGFAQPDTAHA